MYVVSFPTITDAEDDEDDGIEYDFCWQKDVSDGKFMLIMK